GILKVQDPGLFASQIRDYQLIGDPLVAITALLLPWVEILSAAGLVVRKAYQGSLVLVGGSLLVFLVAHGISWARGLDISCGCFGGDGAGTNYPLSMARNFIFLLICVILWRRDTAAQSGGAPAHG
ncbi:MAG: MauE/DoxX family redox-associated membrane protein, partial [Verrucomicrobiota bacterium]